MATTYHQPHPNVNAGALPHDVHATLYHQGLPVSDLDFQESRYPPALAAPKQRASQDRRSSSLMESFTNEELPRRRSSSSGGKKKRLTQSRSRDELQSPLPEAVPSGSHSPTGYLPTPSEEEDQDVLGRPTHTRTQSKASVPGVVYSVPSTRRVVERYNLDDDDAAPPPAAAGNSHAQFISPVSEAPLSLRASPTTSMAQRLQQGSVSPAAVPPGPRHPSIPTTTSNTGSFPSPLAAAPTTSPPFVDASRAMPPVSSKPRASAQFPTYITPALASPVNPVYSPAPIPKEEVCVECAMRDKDMADVDVTGSGVWERESDILWEELKERERLEASAGSSNGHGGTDPKRPKTKGHKLTEQNLKFWLTMVSLLFVSFDPVNLTVRRSRIQKNPKRSSRR